MEHMEQNVDENNPKDESNRLGPCEVCGAKEGKYTCPRCEVKTCSLKCVNIHKKELECSGIRDQLSFKPMSKFSNLDLLSDYRLLEDVTRSVQQIQVDPVKRVPHQLPNFCHSLRKAAHARGMRVHFLPRNFKRAQENTSRVDHINKVVKWKIEWVFPQAGINLVSQNVPDTARLAQVLSPLLDPDQCEDEDQKLKMQYYYSASTSGVCVLMRVGEMERNRYHVLDLNSSIRGNLIRKSIIEHPTFIVLLSDHKYSYDIYNSDEEGEEQWRGDWGSNAGDPTRSTSAEPPVKKSKSESNNFLFGGGDASSDDES